MYTTPHAKQRFYERVGQGGLPRKSKDKTKFIEKYLKEAFNKGLTPKQIDDKYLRDYMNGKLKQSEHSRAATKITHYKNNLFLFKGHRCITILDVPEKASDSIDDSIYVNKLHPFINKLNEKEYVKNWLHDVGKTVEKTTNLKKIICTYPFNMDYKYILNNVPMRAIHYVKNDSHIKKVLIKTNKKRSSHIRDKYYFIWALMLLIPKHQIIPFQKALENNNKSVFNIINNDSISKKQIEICYKQLYILLNGKITPKYTHFALGDDSNIDIISDYFISIIHEYLLEVKQLFK